MLEAFSKLGSDDLTTSRSAGSDIFAHVAVKGSELDYAVSRLVRGLESSKVSTRTASYSTLVAFLGLKQLKVSQLREIVGKTLQTDQSTSTKERRHIYIARILACGAIIRVVPLVHLLQDEVVFKSILGDLVDLGKKRSTLLDLATPFIIHILNDKKLTQSIFEDVIWPVLVPLFANLEVKTEKENDDQEGEDMPNGEEAVVKQESVEKDARAAILLTALTCYDKGLKTDFDFLNDLDRVVKILLAHRIANMPQIVELIIKYVKKQDLAKEFWTSLMSQMRSSHFETVCVCVQKSVEAGIRQSLIVSTELVIPLLGVFRNDEASDQHAQAVKTLSALLKWSTKDGEKMGKKERKSVIKSLFGGSPNLLHEYQKLLRIMTPFLGELCTEKDLTVLGSVLSKHLDSETSLSVRMCIVYIQFLSRIAQSKKASPELKLSIGKRLFSIAFGKQIPNLTKASENSNKADNGDDNSEKEDGDDEDEEKEDIVSQKNDTKEAVQHVSKSCMEAFKSLIGSSYNPQFLEEMIQLVSEDLDHYCKEKETKKLFKKAEKQRDKTTDIYLKYILGSYAIILILEQDKVLGEAQTYLEELLEISKSSSEDATAGIMQFMLSTVTKDEQPPFDFESVFSRLVIENKISEEIIQQISDIVDVDVNEDEQGDEDEDSSDDDDEETEEKMDVSEDDEKDKESDNDEEEEEKPAKISKSKAKNAQENDEDEDDDGSDSESSIDMDDATEEDLANMNKALAKVFATKKKVKEEETSEIRSLMRTFRLLEALFSRNAKVCPISIPLMLLMPIIHALQHASRGKKSNKSLSTRIVSVLNKLNAIKKIEGGDSVEKGTLLTMSKDLVTLIKQGKNRLIGDLLGDSIVMLTKCYLQGNRRTKGEDTGFVALYTGLLDLKDDTRNKSMGISSNLISSALTTLPNWDDGKDALVKRILSIIFNPAEIRHFRRMQFLILLRAAVSDNSNAPELSKKWKIDAVKGLTQHAGKYFPSTTSPNGQNLIKELLLTLTDPSTTSDPEISDVIEKFFKKLYKDHSSKSSSEGMKAAFNLARRQPQVRKFLVKIGLTDVLAAEEEPPKISQSNGTTPKSTTKVKAGSKRKSEAVPINSSPLKSASTPSSTTTPSKKKKSKHL